MKELLAIAGEDVLLLFRDPTGLTLCAYRRVAH